MVMDGMFYQKLFLQSQEQMYIIILQDKITNNEVNKNTEKTNDDNNTQSDEIHNVKTLTKPKVYKNILERKKNYK